MPPEDSKTHILQQIHRAEQHIAIEAYGSAIKACSKSMEIGLKVLYAAIEPRLENHTPWQGYTSWHESRFRRPFDYQRAGFGSLIGCFQRANLWNLVRVEVDSNLYFTERIPWDTLRSARNRATHEPASFTRENALEHHHWAKVFVYDTGLATGGRKVFQVLEAPELNQCRGCRKKLLADWKYCPNCGTRAVHPCTKCKRSLEPDWSICPSCNTSVADSVIVGHARDHFRIFCRGIWADMVVTHLERQALERLRIQLGITPDDAERIEKEVAPDKYVNFRDLLEAVFLDNHIDSNEHEFLVRKGITIGFTKEEAENIIHHFKTEAERDDGATGKVA